MRVHIIANQGTNPPGKLADAELHFTDGACEDWGPLTGLKLVGFAVWARRDGVRMVTFPSRSYAVNGERRSFVLLRPTEANSQDRLRDVILEAYAEHEAEAE